MDNAIEAAHLVPRKEDNFIHLHIIQRCPYAMRKKQ
ncbi:hypothetical protein JO375_10640 [Paenibacillus sp. UY79]|nr:hypothetical protein [Paenibacillus farraposensis]